MSPSPEARRIVSALVTAGYVLHRCPPSTPGHEVERLVGVVVGAKLALLDYVRSLGGYGVDAHRHADALARPYSSFFGNGIAQREREALDYLAHLESQRRAA